MEPNLITIPVGKWVAIMRDQYDRPAGIVAHANGQTIKVPLDRVMIRALADTLMDAWRELAP